MPFPQTVDSAPGRASHLGGSDGATHSNYDDSVMTIVNRIQNFAANAGWPGGTNLKTYIDDRTTTIRSKAGTNSDVGVGVGDNDTGLTKPSENLLRIVLNALTVAEITNTTFAFAKTISTQEQIFVPNMDTTPTPGEDVHWHSGGQLTRLSSSRRSKENERKISGALDKLRAMQPKFFDVIGRQQNLPGRTVGVASFIAEDMAQVDGALVSRDEEGQPSGLITPAILAFTVAAVRELDEWTRSQVDQLGGRISGINSTVNDMVESISESFDDVKRRLSALEEAKAGVLERIGELDVRLSTAIDQIVTPEIPNCPDHSELLDSIVQRLDALESVEPEAEGIELLRSEMGELRNAVQRLDVRRFG